MTLARLLWRWGIVPMVAFTALSGAALAQVEVPRGGVAGPPGGIGGVVIDPRPLPQPLPQPLPP